MTDRVDFTSVEEYRKTDSGDDGSDAKRYRSFGFSDVLTLVLALISELGTVQVILRKCLVDWQTTDSGH